MILPAVKLGTLALKTICKPIANRLKKEAGLHPKFRHFIINMAQANHRFTTRMQRRIYGRSVDAVIRPLDEEKAVQASADLIGELFVFSVAGAAVIFEVQRSSRSEARKEEKRRQEIEAMMQRDEELAREIQVLKQKLDEVEQVARGRSWWVQAWQCYRRWKWKTSLITQKTK
ncbi:optic atrophy protein [Salix suchowensis]|nr:optic atrophy protein [Salix suchowensis]